MRKILIASALSLVIALALLSPVVLVGQQPVFRSGTQLVHVDVVVRDSKGDVVKGLTQNDFEVYEDGKPEQISTFAFEEITSTATPIETAATLASAAKALNAQVGTPAPASPAATAPAAAAALAPAAPPKALTSDDVAGHRVWVLLFDTSSMQPEDVDKTAEAAIKWVNDKMTPADLVGIASIGSTLTPLVDLTSNREKLLQALRTFTTTDGTATAAADASTMASDETAATDDSAATVDQSSQELDSFNNDVRLRGIKTICDALQPVEQRKALVYFSSGMSRNGADNQVELRSAENACKRANVAIDTVDARGLQAVAPFGSARQRSTGGTEAFSGRGVQRQFTQLAAQQETLSTLAADTGGSAFLDSNDFGQAFDQVMKAISSYYILGYSSGNTAKDGRFRNIEVRLKNTKSGYKIDRAREGYYADRDFAHTANTDRETQLQDQLYAGIPATDVPVFLTSGFFRLATRVQTPGGRGFPGGPFGGRGGGPGGGPGGRGQGGGPLVPRDDHNFYVPISITLPGSAIPPNKDKVTLDIRGFIQDERRNTIGTIKDTLTVPAMTPEQLAQHPVLYQTGMVMGPGRYTVKVVVRENSTGQMGSFETPVQVPDLSTAPVRVSSIVLSTQLVQTPPTAKKSDNPLIHDGIQILPNLTHVVSKDQHLYFYYEVYDPSGEAAPQVRTGLAFYRGRTKVFETPVVERTSIDAADRHAAIFQFDVPASEFKTGLYTCQVNIVDEVAGKFAFPRLDMYVR